MDPRERLNIPNEALLVLLEGRQATMWTAIPGVVQGVNLSDAWQAVNGVPTGPMTCQIQPAIMGQYRNPAGIVQTLSLPLLLDCPIVFPGGGPFTLTFPVQVGDEVLVVFACRCIDSWWQNGGVQPPAEYRMHDLSDGFALVGPRSIPRVLNPPVSSTAAQLRSLDGKTVIEVGNQEVTITTDTGATGIKLTPGLVAVTGDITATGEITRGVGGADSVTLGQHIHGTGPPPNPGT